MRKLTTILCLTIAVLLGSAGVSESADNKKGLIAYHPNPNWNAMGVADLGRVMRDLKPLAEQGNVVAQYNLGQILRYGVSGPSNYVDAVKWFRLAAQKGYDRAQNVLGEMYTVGLGVPNDEVSAEKWYRLAAEQGYDHAQNALSSVLFGKNEKKSAEKWAILAAKQGNTYYQYTLGWRYETGDRVPKNYLTAEKWYILAAEPRDAAYYTHRYLEWGSAGSRAQLQVLRKKPEYQNALKKQRAEKKKIENEPLRETCFSFGFKERSKEMSNCMFELYKIDQSKSQSQNVGQNAPSTRSGTAPAVRALIEEQRRAAEAQRKAIEAQQGIEIMRQGLEMMKPRQRNNSNGFRIGPNGGMWNCRNGICTK
jgi:TPR repeat protein